MTDQPIQDYIKQVEQERNIHVLFAAEAGSRAWGFPSADSDYDVRMIYIIPLKERLKLHEPKDNFEQSMVQGCLPDIDGAGWELRKALHLLSKSNAGLLEWLHSPIIYKDDYIHRPKIVTYYTEENLLSSNLRSLAHKFIDDQALIFHYANMADRCLQDHLMRRPEVKLKKYFYCIRPLLAAYWVHDGNGMPPVDFMELFNQSKLDDQTRARILQLYNRKISTTSEQDSEVVDMLLLDWIINGIQAVRQLKPPEVITGVPPKLKKNRPSMDILDDFYLEQVLRHEGIDRLAKHSRGVKDSV